MRQEIQCRKDQCLDKDAITTELDKLFDDFNIIDRIEHDLIEAMIG